jgi:tol-pal system protein YbgF
VYQQALQDYDGGNYAVACKRFRQFLRQFPRSPLAGEAQYWIGESLYQQRQWEAAIAAFDAMIQKYQHHPRIPAALLKQGYAFAALQDMRNARFFLRQVQQQYPYTPEAQQAEKISRSLMIPYPSLWLRGPR